MRSSAADRTSHVRAGGAGEDGTPGSDRSVARDVLGTGGEQNLTQPGNVIEIDVHWRAGKDRTILIPALALIASGRTRAEAAIDCAACGAEVGVLKSVVEHGMTDGDSALSRHRSGEGIR